MAMAEKAWAWHTVRGDGNGVAIMRDTLDRARRDMERLKAEHNATQAALIDLEKRIEDVSTYIRMAEFYADENAELAGRPRGGTSGAAVRMVIDHLRNVGHAVHTRQLLDMLKEGGVTIGGGNPVANLSGFLSRSEELTNSRSHGWALTEWGRVAPGAGPMAPWAVTVSAHHTTHRLDDGRMWVRRHSITRTDDLEPPPRDPPEPLHPESSNAKPPQADVTPDRQAASSDLDDDVSF